MDGGRRPSPFTKLSPNVLLAGGIGFMLKSAGGTRTRRLTTTPC
jgi:hypothetical protein